MFVWGGGEEGEWSNISAVAVALRDSSLPWSRRCSGNDGHTRQRTLPKALAGSNCGAMMTVMAVLSGLTFFSRKYSSVGHRTFVLRRALHSATNVAFIVMPCSTATQQKSCRPLPHA